MSDIVVHDVRGTWRRWENGRQSLRLDWTTASGSKRFDSLTDDTIAALTAYLTQPREPTPEERARALHDRYFGGTTSCSSGHSEPCQFTKLVGDEIAAAVQAERAREGA